jgi:hypothetical protein
MVANRQNLKTNSPQSVFFLDSDKRIAKSSDLFIQQIWSVWLVGEPGMIVESGKSRLHVFSLGRIH